MPLLEQIRRRCSVSHSSKFHGPETRKGKERVTKIVVAEAEAGADHRPAEMKGDAHHPGEATIGVHLRDNDPRLGDAIEHRQGGLHLEIGRPLAGANLRVIVVAVAVAARAASSKDGIVYR